MEAEATLYLGLKIFAGLGYRILSGSAAGIDRSYLSGPTVEFGFRMGD